MATKVVTPRVFPDGTAVEAYPAYLVDVERRERRPIQGTPTDSGVIASGAITITGNAGIYVLTGVVDEIQSIAISATAGQFKITFTGQQTANIAYNADGPTTVQAALEALSNIAPGDVAVTGGPGDAGGTTPYVVKFLKTYAGTDVAAMTVANGTTPLSGGTGATVTTSTAGSQGTVGSQLGVFFQIDA